MKKLIALLLVVMMTVSAFACAKAPEAAAPAESEQAAEPAAAEEPKAEATEAPAEPVTISWCMNETANLPREKYQAIVDEFEKAHPEIKVELELYTELSVNTYKTMIAGGTLPDIINGAYIVASIDGVLTEAPEWLTAKFKPGYLAESNGAIRTIPSVAQGVWGVIYHKDMFEAAGITEEPATWDAFVEACAKLQTSGVAPLMGWGTTNETFFSIMWIAAELCNELRAAYPNFSEQIKTGEVKWTDEVVKKNLERFQWLSGSGYLYAGSNSLDYGNAVAEFQNGGAAMIVDGVWSLTGLDPEKYGVFILPDGAGTNASTMTTSYWGVNEQAENKDACWTFIDWALCGDGQQIFTDQILSADAQVSCALESVSYEMDPLVKEFYDTLNTRDTYVNQFELAGENALPDGFAAYVYTALATIFFEGADIDETLTAMQSEYETLLSEQAD